MAFVTSVERVRQHGEAAKQVASGLRQHQADRLGQTIKDLLHRRLSATDPRHRAHYSAADRTLIMTLADENFWTPKDIAARFVIDISQARHWRHEWMSNPESTLFTGKAERMFRTIKLWQRAACLLWSPTLNVIQCHLDRFRDWYNENRVHQGIGGLTPDEMWTGIKRSEPVRYLARDKLNPVFTVRRIHHCGDPHLPVFDIQVSAKRKTA